MKLTKIFLAVVAAVLALSCAADKEEAVPTPPAVDYFGPIYNDGVDWCDEGSVVGKWELSLLNGNGGENKPRVYIEFKEDGTFDLYQRFTSAEKEHYTGTYTFENNILSGEYSDKVKWSETYNVEFAEEPVRLRFIPVNSQTIYVYTAIEKIPFVDEEQKEPTTDVVRSIDVVRFL